MPEKNVPKREEPENGPVQHQPELERYQLQIDWPKAPNVGRWRLGYRPSAAGGWPAAKITSELPLGLPNLGSAVAT
jgi:hypothetical protein